MSSFLCFICHSTVNSDTHEETREKYRDVIGMNLCPDSHLCHICCHVLNKLWLFKSVCLKRSLEYPVLFSEKGTLNLQRNDLEIHTICPEDSCGHYHHRNINSKTYHIHSTHSDHLEYSIDNQYVELKEDGLITDKIFEDYHNVKEPTVFESKEIQTDSPYNDHNDLDNSDKCSEENNEIYEDVVTEFNENIESYNDEVNNGIDTSNNNRNVNGTNAEINENVEENLNNIDQEIANVEQENVTKKKKGKKSKKGFEKIVLTLEEQKAELEARRKEKKYMKAEFKCYNCALGFLFKDTYQAHMMRHEESNGEYRCATCTLRFATQAVLRAHALAHSERRRCVRCGRAVRVRSAPAHARQCRQRRPQHGAACHLCAAMFRDSSGLQQHLKRFHRSKTTNRSYPCGVCGKSYNNQAAVRTHMITHINRKFECDQCSSTFSSPYTLNQHKKKHIPAEVTQHTCTTCNLTYSSRKSLLAHRRNSLNHQQTVFECPICSKMCPTQRSLASHIQSVHSATKNYACPSCPARYSTRKSLVRHIGTHSGKGEAKVVICHLCGASFKGNNKLNRHLKKVCKAKVEEEFPTLYDQECMNTS